MIFVSRRSRLRLGDGVNGLFGCLWLSFIKIHVLIFVCE